MKFLIWKPSRRPEKNPKNMRYALLVIFLGILLPCRSQSSLSVFSSGKGMGIKEAGEILVEASYDSLGWTETTQETFIREKTGYKQNNKWGLLSARKGKPITPAIYDKLFPISENLYGVAIQGKLSNRYFYGIIDKKGKLVLSPDYFSLSSTGSSVLLTQYENGRFQMGAMNFDQRLFMPMIYNEINLTGELLVGSKPSGLLDIFTITGKQVISSVASIEFIPAGIIIRKKGSEGLISREGKILYAPQYKSVKRSGTPVAFDQWQFIAGQQNSTYSCDSIHVFGKKSKLVYRNGSFQFQHIKGKADFPKGGFYLRQAVNDWVVCQSVTSDQWIAVHALGKKILKARDSIIYAHGFFKVKNQKGWKVFDESPQPVTQQVFQDVRLMNRQFLAVKKHDYWALLDGIKSELSAFRYDSIGTVIGKKAIVRYVDQWGVFANNEWLISPAYDAIHHSHGYFVARAGRSYYLFNSYGEILFKTLDQIISEPDLLKLSYEGSVSAIGDSGMPVANTMFDSVSKMGPHYALKLNGRTLLVSSEGKVVLDSTQIQDITSYAEERFIIKRNHKYGFVDSEGKLRIANRYDSVRNFSEGLAPIFIRKKWGFINNSEQLVVQPFYDWVSPMQNGLSIFKRNGKYGVVRKDGEEVFKGIYDQVKRTSSGFFILKKQSVYGLANAKGQLIFSPTYTLLHPLSENYFVAELSGNKGVIDTKGSMVIPFAYDQVRNQKGIFILKKKN